MTDEPITVTMIQETNFDEEAVLNSPYEARFVVKHLPWKEYQEEALEAFQYAGFDTEIESGVTLPTEL